MYSNEINIRLIFKHISLVIRMSAQELLFHVKSKLKHILKSNLKWIHINELTHVQY